MLVSCIVLAYNSAKTVIETLESIKNQTYKEIELIVSDDASTDDTVKICQEWIERNKERFVRTELITVNKNTGIAENCNRGFNQTRGEWVKYIAADDILLPSCISIFVDFAEKHPDAQWVSSYINIYKEAFGENNCYAKDRLNSRTFFDLNAEEQLRRISYSNCLFAPSMFYKRKIIAEVGKFDGKYIFEDWPLHLKILEHGYKCHLLKQATVGYRYHQSISNKTGNIFIYDFVRHVRKFQRKKCFRYLTLRQKIACQVFYLIQDLFQILHINKDNGTWNRVYYKLYNIITYMSGVKQ